MTRGPTCYPAPLETIQKGAWNHGQEGVRRRRRHDEVREAGLEGLGLPRHGARKPAARRSQDAGIPYDEIEQAGVGYCYGDSTCGERAVYELGLTGIPIYNVNNNCSTGSTALFMAKQFVEGGLADCVMALGFEKMEKGSLGVKYTDRTTRWTSIAGAMVEMRGFAQAPAAPQIFGNAGREHMERYGTTPEHFAKIGRKNHKHSVNNPYSQFQDEYTLEEILDGADGLRAADQAAVLPDLGRRGRGDPRERRLREEARPRRSTAVEIAGMAMTTDFPSTFEEKSCIKLVGSDMTRKAAETVYAAERAGPEDIDVVELHDCFSCNELITYEALGLCPEGKGGEFIDSGANTYGGKVVVNPSGGLISKGHPLGATGLAQCAELNWQLRGEADKRQVAGAKLALQHNLGLGGAAVVTLYRKPA